MASRLLHSFPLAPPLATSNRTTPTQLRRDPLTISSSSALFSSYFIILPGTVLGCRSSVCSLYSQRARRGFKALVAPMTGPEGQLVYDVFMSAFAAGVALSLLRFWEEMAKRGLEQKLNRKLVHISIGMVFMLLWPLFSSGIQAPYLAALAPGVNIIRMLLLGLGVWKNDAMVKSISRGGDYRELLKGPLYYACTITMATIVFWRTSPVAIATICNLCAGDGIVKFAWSPWCDSITAEMELNLTSVADIVGRRFGGKKLPYNQNKSFAGSIAMAVAGFVASVMYMHYFSWFGFIEESTDLVLGFLLVSLATAIVESLPISSELDDNLTVPLTSLLVGSFVF